MSFWFRYRDKQGAMHEVSISFVPMMFVVALAGIIAVIVWPLVHAFRDAAGHSPVAIAAFCSAALGLGLVAFAAAKVSVIRKGRVVSFGAAAMSPKMRVLYVVGYVILALGASCILLLLLALTTGAGG